MPRADKRLESLRANPVGVRLAELSAVLSDEAERLARDYAVVVLRHPDRTGYLAEVPDFPYVCASGETPAEALECAFDGIASVLAVMLEDGDPIPEPTYRVPAGVQS